MADVGFGVQPAAHHFGLDFIPVVDEDYYFACERARLERAPLATVIELLRGSAFRAQRRASGRLRSARLRQAGRCGGASER